MCERVIGIQIGKSDFTEIFRFEPMDHGRHCTAGASGKAEEFNELQSTRCQADRGGIGGVELGSA
jgi:hypothetical protein